MKVVRDAEDLAVCIPDHVIEALALREGDEIFVRIIADGSFEIALRNSPVAFDTTARALAPDWIDFRDGVA